MKDVIIIDYGSQYTKVIRSRLHDLGHDAKILPAYASLSQLGNPAGIILSGGPASVYEEGAPQLSDVLIHLIFEKNTPTLAICYGMQLISEFAARNHYKVVQPQSGGEYGVSTLTISHPMGVLKALKKQEIVLMSHGDAVSLLPPGFQLLASTKHCRLAAIQHNVKPIFCLQFHPEVYDTKNGKKILQNFLDICGAKPNWDRAKELERMEQEARERIGNKYVVAFISLGNDSSVLAYFLKKVVPQTRLFFLYVRGLAADSELEKIPLIGGNFGVIDARKRFFRGLKGVSDPEQKRKIIGKIFAQIWQEETKKLAKGRGCGTNDFILAQGTIAPDIIEEGSAARHSETIKTHHNRVKEIQELLAVGGVVEPFTNLFKEDVREIGRMLGVPEALITQHPRPGPEKAVRFLCADKDTISRDKRLQQALLCEEELQEMCKRKRYSGWILPLKSKGVQGDGGTYNYVAGIIGPYLKKPLLELANEIPNRFKGKISRVVYLVAPADTSSLACLGCKTDDFNPHTKKILDATEEIFIRHLRLANLYSQIAQAFTVASPLSFDMRGYTVILRAVDTRDFMTATCHWLPWPLLQQTALEIMRKIPECQLVVFDLTGKPPGTIEWE